MAVISVKNVPGQFAPAAGEPGSTALHKDSSIFVSWANTCTIARGYINITDTTATFNNSNRASVGEADLATGMAENYVVSLGDKGQAILTFPNGIGDGNGFDFAVFENGFAALDEPGKYYLELAFVEVSSDGQHFVRFPATSNIPAAPQTGSFDNLDPTLIHNLAGKYEVHYGTPFDLQDLADSTGIDLNQVTHVKIIDVGGTTSPEYASLDAQGNIINDPFPTAFHSGGFDLDAVGVINESDGFTNVSNNEINYNFRIFPNPTNGKINLQVRSAATISCFNSIGKLVFQKQQIQNNSLLDIAHLPEGIYIIHIKTKNKTYIEKLIKTGN